MNSPLSAAEDFLSPRAKYELYNFHRPDDRHRAREALRGPKPRIVTLEGLDEENHLLLLDAACYQASREGQPWECVRLSFEDYNPDSCTAESFLNSQLTRREARVGKVEKLREALSGLALGLKAELDISTAFAISVTVSGGLRFAELLETAAPTFKAVRGYPAEGPERLAALLSILTADSGVVLYLPGSYPLNITLRRWLIDISKHNDRLLLAFANMGADAAERMTLRAPVREHFELAPLELEELTAAVDERFGPNTFPADFYDALYVQSKGIPWRLAEIMKRLMYAGALEGGGSQAWRIADPEASRSMASQFISTFYEPVAKLRESRDSTDQMVATFIDLSALFRDEIPGYLLCTHLGLELRRADHFLNNILRLFGPDSETRILMEIGRHPDFPRERLLRFTNRLARATFVDAYTPDELDGAASDLMDTLTSRLGRITLGAARLCYALSMHRTDEDAHGRYGEELSWWVGREEASELRAYISEAVTESLISSDALLSVVDQVMHGWPPYRIEAVIGGLEDSGVGIPLQQMSDYHGLRANICYAVDEFEAGERHARAGLEATDERDNVSKMMFLALLWHAAMRRGDLHMALTHAEAAVQIAKRSRSLAASAMWAWGHLGLVFVSIGRHSEAEEAADELIRLANKGLDSQSVDMSRACLDAANIYSKVGKPARALPYITRSLEIRRAHYGVGSAAEPTALMLLAEIHAQLGDLIKAKHASDSAVSIATAVFGPENSRTADAYSSAADIMIKQANYDAAAPLLLRALSIREKEFGVDHIGVAIALRSLSACYETRDPRQAESYLDRLVEVYTRRRELGWTRSADDLVRLLTLIEKSGDLPRTVARGEELLVRIRGEPEDGATRDSEPLEHLVESYRQRLHINESTAFGLRVSADLHTRVAGSSVQAGGEPVEQAGAHPDPQRGWLARLRNILFQKNGGN